ncbi:hypothetical protein K445DRAFT_171631 [Daldinia sp. EC12]|nr:hypothetical protein K445DRAFT_171631 [Daldinia sp. EC12]
MRVILSIYLTYRQTREYRSKKKLDELAFHRRKQTEGSRWMMLGPLPIFERWPFVYSVFFFFYPAVVLTSMISRRHGRAKWYFK